MKILFCNAYRHKRVGVGGETVYFGRQGRSEDLEKRPHLAKLLLKSHPGMTWFRNDESLKVGELPEDLVPAKENPKKKDKDKKEENVEEPPKDKNEPPKEKPVKMLPKDGMVPKKPDPPVKNQKEKVVKEVVPKEDKRRQDSPKNEVKVSPVPVPVPKKKHTGIQKKSKDK